MTMTPSPVAAPAGLPARELAHKLLTNILRRGQSFGDAVEEMTQLDRLAEPLVRAVAEQGTGRVVPGGDHAAQGLGDDRIGR